uniref:Uncharacterized protein n=1 Tax=Brassica campestris TaxID=3711 RepID=A0A3P5YE72_BRACM|nr:unnamed protein product [Brassica rapa]
MIVLLLSLIMAVISLVLERELKNEPVSLVAEEHFRASWCFSNEDLENTVVDESQRHTENEGPNDLRNEKFSGFISEGTATESDDENEREDDIDPSIKSVGFNYPLSKKEEEFT